MAFDWGAFLGAAGESGVNTYEKLQAIELQKLQNDRLKRQVADEEGFRKAISDVDAQQYNGGTAIPVLAEQGLSSGKFTPEQKQQLGKDFAAMPPEQAKAAMGALSNTGHTNEGYDFSKIGVYQGKDGQMLGTNDYTPMDPSKRAGLVVDRMMQEGNLYGVEKGLALNKGFREFEATKRYDEHREKVTDMQKNLTVALTDKGLSHAPDVINKYLEGTDYSVKYVPGKSGPGQIMVYEKDKPTGQSYGDMQSIVKAATSAMTMQFSDQMMSFFSNPTDAGNWMLKQEEIRLKKREVAAKERETAAKVGYYGASAKNVGRGTPTMFYNSDNKQTAYADPKNPNGLLGIDGKPIADATGFVPATIAQVQANKDSNTMVVNTETGQVGFVNQNSPSGITDVNGNPIEKADGFMPVALAQTKVTAGKKSVDGYVNPRDNSQATMVNGVLVGPDNKPVPNPADFRKIGTKTDDTSQASILKGALDLVTSNAEPDIDIAIQKSIAAHNQIYNPTASIPEGAVTALKEAVAKDPNSPLVQQFDSKYGKGSAAKVLGQ